jgi:SAM-dependent methyltransferase
VRQVAHVEGPRDPEQQRQARRQEPPDLDRLDPLGRPPDEPPSTLRDMPARSLYHLMRAPGGKSPGGPVMSIISAISCGRRSGHDLVDTVAEPGGRGPKVPTAAYDEIADWYEHEFLAGRRDGGVRPGDDPAGIDRAVGDLLGAGVGVCLEIGCGTGVNAARVRGLGWTPVGIDLSAGMLRHARGRLPVARAAAERLPIADGAVPAVIAVMVHTDMPAYPAVLAEAARVLRPGGMLVHVGVHPCFCGGFADRGDPDAVVIRPGYLDGHWTKASWTDQGVRARVGATHRALPELLHAVLDAGLVLERFAEGGRPTPVVLAVRARKRR